MTDDWIDIKDQDVPKDGSWFVIWVPGFMPEVGRYNPADGPIYKETGRRRLYRLVKEANSQWEGFSSMQTVSHWKPLEPPGETGA